MLVQRLKQLSKDTHSITHFLFCLLVQTHIIAPCERSTSKHTPSTVGQCVAYVLFFFGTRRSQYKKIAMDVLNATYTHSSPKSIHRCE